MNLYNATDAKTTGKLKVSVPISHVEIGFEGLESLTTEVISTSLQTGNKGEIKGLEEMNLLSAIINFQSSGGAVVQHEVDGLFYARIPINQIGGFEILDGESLVITLGLLDEEKTYSVNGIEEFVIDGYGRRLLRNDTAVMQLSENKRSFNVAGYSAAVLRGVDHLDTIEFVGNNGKRKERPVDELIRESVYDDEVKQISLVEVDKNEVVEDQIVPVIMVSFPNVLKIDLEGISQLILKKSDTSNPVYLDYVKSFV